MAGTRFYTTELKIFNVWVNGKFREICVDSRGWVFGMILILNPDITSCSVWVLKYWVLGLMALCSIINHEVAAVNLDHKSLMLLSCLLTLCRSLVISSIKLFSSIYWTVRNFYDRFVIFFLVYSSTFIYSQFNWFRYREHFVHFLFMSIFYAV